MESKLHRVSIPDFAANKHHVSLAKKILKQAGANT